MENEENNVTVKTNKAGALSITGLVFGIISIVLMFVGIAMFWSYIVGLVFSLIGTILCAVGMKKEGKTGVAIAGLVLSIIALVVNAILFISCAVCAGAILGSAAAVAGA